MGAEERKEKMTAEFGERVERIAREKQKGAERIWESWRV